MHNESKRLLDLCRENPKQFWQRMKVRSKMNSRTCPIKLNDFYKYFMKLSPDNVELKSGYDLEWQEYVHKRLAIESPVPTIEELDKS